MNKELTAEEIAAKIIENHEMTIYYDEGCLITLENNIAIKLKEFAQMKVELFWDWYCNHPNKNIDNEYTKEEMFKEFFKRTP